MHYGSCSLSRCGAGMSRRRGNRESQPSNSRSFLKKEWIFQLFKRIWWRETWPWSPATIIPASRAVTWQFTGMTNEAVVRERYWVTFRPGEVRTCANCHGINDKDQIGRPSPTNAPLALRELLRLWRTNAANAYSLTVSNGTGSGSFGAGTILSV